MSALDQRGRATSPRSPHNGSDRRWCSRRADQPETELFLLVELALILSCGEPVPRRPCRAGVSVPDAREAFTASILVGRHAPQPESLSGELGEERLIVGCGQPVPRQPVQAGLLLPNGAEQDLVAGPEDRQVDRAKPCEPSCVIACWY